MTKVATVSAQQMWEYATLSLKTQDYLVNELNEHGLSGWELVSVTYHRDIKGVGENWSWTAFLKRPRVPAHKSSHEEAQKTEKDPTEQYRKGRIEVGDLSDAFEVRAEDESSPD